MCACFFHQTCNLIQFSVTFSSHARLRFQSIDCFWFYFTVAIAISHLVTYRRTKLHRFCCFKDNAVPEIRVAFMKIVSAISESKLNTLNTHPIHKRMKLLIDLPHMRTKRHQMLLRIYRFKTPVIILIMWRCSSHTMDQTDSFTTSPNQCEISRLKNELWLLRRTLKKTNRSIWSGLFNHIH